MEMVATTEIEPTEAELATIGLELATRKFHEFVKQAWHIVEPEMQYRDNWHIRAICEHLEAVYDGRVQNLLCNVPPGSMKSLLVCVFWPAWVWANNPAKRFMFSSYSETLSMRDSLRCRNVISSEWYQERWPLTFSDDQNTKGKFQNEQGGWRMVGSIGGKGTGEHPDFFAIDDPHNVVQAESLAELQAVTDWMDGTVATRGVSRGVRRVMIMQRVSAKDASAHALEKGGWTHICLPMRYEAPVDGKPRMPVTDIGWQDPRQHDGDLLWPSLYPENVVANMEIQMGIYHAAGQLQQRPSPRGGGKFKREWFPILTACPQLISVVRYWDKAGTKGGTGAQSCGVAMGAYTDNLAVLPAMKTKYIVLDVLTCREEAAEREAIIKQTALADFARWGPIVNVWVEQEPGSGGKESAQATVSNLVGFACYIERVTGSKEVRADPLSSQSSVGKISLLQGAWNSAYLDEMEMFPVGKLKDMVDGSSGAFNHLVVGTGAFGGGGDDFPGRGGDLNECPVELASVDDRFFG